MGMEERDGNEKMRGMKEFLPPAACGGGCEREAVAGGGEVSMIGRHSSTPQKFADANFYPPRKRRRVRYFKRRRVRYFFSLCKKKYPHSRESGNLPIPESVRAMPAPTRFIPEPPDEYATPATAPHPPQTARPSANTAPAEFSEKQSHRE